VHQRNGHVVAIANIRDIQALHRAKFFDDGLGIGHRLAGMAEIAQAVDDRHRRPLGQFDNMGVLKHARHHHLDVARHDTGHIRNRFAFAEADFVGGKIKRVAAHVAHGHIERNAGAQAGLLENHAQHLAFEQGRVALRKVFLLKRMAKSKMS
jgi:hypothetical protein